MFLRTISRQPHRTCANPSRLWHQDLDPVRGLTVVEIIHRIHPAKFNGMYIEANRIRTPT